MGDAVSLGYDRWADRYADRDASTSLDEPLLVELAGSLAHRRVLDVACGTGRYTRLLARHGADVTGLDASRGMIARARRTSDPAITWILASATHLPFADHTFDLLTSGLLLDHLPELAPAFREMSRVLRPSGRAIITAIHPDMQRITGANVVFDGGTIPGHLHELEDIESTAIASGLYPARRHEPTVTPAMAAADPRWRWRLGIPALVIYAFDHL